MSRPGLSDVYDQPINATEMGAYVPDGRDLAAWLADGPRRQQTPAAEDEEDAQSEASSSRSALPPKSRLPLELILQIAQYLVEPIPQALPFAASTNDTPVTPTAYIQPSSTASSSSLLPPSYNVDRSSYLAVLHLSSLSTSLRRLLAPLVWQQVLIHRTDRLGKLRALVLDYYQRLASSFSDVDRLVYPLPLVRVLRIEMPDRYLSFDQEILRQLLRSGLNPQAKGGSLHTLVWDAEMLPSPAVWKILGEGEKMEGLEEELRVRKGATLDREQIRALANSGRGEGVFNPRHPRIRPARSGSSDRSSDESEGSVKATADSLDDDLTFESLSLSAYDRRSRPPRRPSTGAAQNSLAPRAVSSSTSSSRRSRPPPPPPRGLQSLAVNCKVFWGLHVELSRLRCLQHLHLTSFDSHLLPPHLPSLLISLHRPLRSISLSSSKTSLLHDWDLIRRGVLSRVEHMDVYPVTPEWPLVAGLRSAAGSLRNLRLILDVSGSFGNFDRLWSDLVTGADLDKYTDDDVSEDRAPRRLGDGRDDHDDDFDLDGKDDDEQDDMIHPPAPADPAHPRATLFPHLERLVVDPFPQQNTAPSFTAFLETCCPKLKWLNGKKIDEMPKGLEMWHYDPSNLSGAFPY